MNKIILAGALLLSPSVVHGQEGTDEDTREVMARIQENMTYALREPCKGLEGTTLLNCRLKSPGQTEEQIFAEKIRKSRSRFNLYLANSMNLPVSVEDNSSLSARNGELIPPDRPAIKIHWLPDSVQTRLNVKEIAIRYTKHF